LCGVSGLDVSQVVEIEAGMREFDKRTEKNEICSFYSFNLFNFFFSFSIISLALTARRGWLGGHWLEKAEWATPARSRRTKRKEGSGSPARGSAPPTACSVQGESE
jgi:hypothetical protein